MGSFISGLHADAQELLSWRELVIKATAAAAGTKHSICAAQGAAASRVYLMSGDGAIDLSSAEADALVDGVVDATEKSALKTGLMTYFTNIAAEADAAKSYAFVLSLGSLKDVAAVSLESNSRSATGTNSVYRHELISAALHLQDASINSSNQLLQDDGSTAVTTSNQLVVIQKYGMAFGLISCADGGGGLPAANDILTFRALIKA